MSVIVELRVGAGEFELGRVLEPLGDSDVELETVVPLREQPVPLVLVRDHVGETVESRIARHPSVEAIREVERHERTVLYALDWDASRDRLVEAMSTVEGHLRSGRTDGSAWAFEVRFPSHDALSRFGERCEDARVDITLDRIYDPSGTGRGPWPGLTERQRETLVRAVDAGYYDIPRRISTATLAEEFGVSDQAITERLRRAIVALTEHTLLVSEIDEE